MAEPQTEDVEFERETTEGMGSTTLDSTIPRCQIDGYLKDSDYICGHGSIVPS